ncbi:MAG: hydrolase 1, exosortase A system-associated [Erythrobacter sp.]|nr:hydrolase 1, exosortase A system-associated [Erythrobacter sp.]
MSRLPLTFGCGTFRLAATLDTAPGTSGLLIVSGGNEIRSGAFGGQAELAARIARAGFPVFRFDRRGVGDSEGENRGFRRSLKDIAAAIEAFRAIAPQIERVVAFGNCDAASALMLAQGDLCDALVLSNPWTIEDDPGKLPPAAVRARYLEKLKNPRELIRLATGKVSPAKLASGLRQALSRAPAPSSLAEEMARGLDASGKPYVILLAANDRTAQVFETQWPYDLAAETQGEVRRCEGASHAYVEPHARDWLEQQILAMLRG